MEKDTTILTLEDLARRITKQSEISDHSMLEAARFPAHEDLVPCSLSTTRRGLELELGTGEACGPNWRPIACGAKFVRRAGP